MLPGGETVMFVYGISQRVDTLTRMSITSMQVKFPFREAYHTAEYP